MRYVIGHALAHACAYRLDGPFEYVLGSSINASGSCLSACGMAPTFLTEILFDTPTTAHCAGGYTFRLRSLVLAQRPTGPGADELEVASDLVLLSDDKNDRRLVRLM